MENISEDTFWRSEFNINVSAENGFQVINFNQLKLRINDTYKQNEITTTNFQPSNPDHTINKGYLHTELVEINGHLWCLEKKCNGFRLRCDSQAKQSDEIPTKKAVKTNKQILYDKGLVKLNKNEDEVLKDYLLLKLTKGADVT